MCFKKLWFHINMWLCVHPLTNKELNSNILSDISKSILFSAWDCVWFQALLKLCNHHSLVIFDETWTSRFYVLLTMHSCIIFFKWRQLGAHINILRSSVHLVGFNWKRWTSSLFICADDSWLTIIRQISTVSCQLFSVSPSA